MKALTISILPEWKQQTINELLTSTFHLGKKIRYELRLSKKVFLDDHVITNFNKPLLAGQRLSLPIFAQKEIPETKSSPLEIFYEDHFLILVNKPIGVKTHPNTSSESNTFVNHVQYYLNVSNQSPACALPVHRLDQTTSGLILFAKNNLALAAMSYQLEKRKIQREYIAVVEGFFSGTRTIKKPIGKDRHTPSKQHISSSGKRAVTHVKSIAVNKKDKLSLIRCKLETGRTHQIRVHLASMNLPILGDDLYGSKRKHQRIMLHAEYIQFYHPFFNQIFSFTSSAKAFWPILNL